MVHPRAVSCYAYTLVWALSIKSHTLWYWPSGSRSSHFLRPGGVQHRSRCQQGKMLRSFRRGSASSAPEIHQDDDERLRELGYKPVLRRSWRKFTNAAVTISSMSVLLSITSSFGTGLTYGGPAICLWGWVFVSFCTWCLSMGMSELASAYPTSGGMYYWIFQLLPPWLGRPICWINGWLNLLGQIASLSSTHYFMTTLIQTMVLLNTGTARPPDMPPPPYGPPYAPPDAPAAPGVEASAAPAVADYADYAAGDGFIFNSKQTLGIYAGCLIVSALICTVGRKALVYLTEFGAIWHLIGVVLVIVVIPCVATYHQPADWVFRKFEYDLGEEEGINNRFYIGILGLLLPAYSFTGLDGPAHMAEESSNAAIANPNGIMAGVYFMIVTGWIWVVSLLFCVSDRNYILGYGDITPEADGDPVPQIFWDAFQQRTGSGRGGLIFLLIPLGGVFFCAVSTLTYVSRIMFAYSRDRAVPLSWLWVKLDSARTPVFAVWGAAIGAFILAIPSVWNDLAFEAIISLSTIALTVAYVLPTLARITIGRKRFQPGPWSLGVWAYPLGIVSVLYMIFIVITFSLPTEYPVDTKTNLNYAGVTLGACLALSIIWYWFPFFGAYKWFQGPLNEVDRAELEKAQLEAGAPARNLDGLHTGLSDLKPQMESAEMAAAVQKGMVDVDPK